MRKETSAGVIAGAVSGAPAGFTFAVLAIFTLLGFLESRSTTSRHLALKAHPTLLLVLEVSLVVRYVAVASFFGAIAGFIFVKTVNKLPLRSTYVKAVLPWPFLLILSTLLLLFLRPSLNRLIGIVKFELAPFAFLLVDAMFFAYLFNRWANHRQPSPNIQPPTG